jgi:hypothetical protein
MTFQSDQWTLRPRFELDRERVEIPERNLVIENRWFQSAANALLPGAESYRCEQHGVSFPGSVEGRMSETNRTCLTLPDADIVENRRFRFATFRDARQRVTSGVIIVLHGLNERDWGKYLPWALRLMQDTGKAVILFPIAFHMNRAPAAWGNPRLMRAVSDARRANSSTIANSTFANAAISTRLQAQPERFCWSGLQTLYDLSQLVEQLRRGAYDTLDPKSSVNLFAYSIGAFLAEILVMADPNGLFDSSRLFMFCGGATLDRSYPNSRYILDSDATIALYSYFLARFENELRDNRRLAHYVRDAHTVGHYFRAMLDYQEGKEVRDKRFMALSNRLTSLSLRRDKVIPASEVMNTLQGDFREIPIAVTVRDFPYEYSHVDPFPPSAQEAGKRAFGEVFDRASSFLG